VFGASSEITPAAVIHLPVPVDIVGVEICVVIVAILTVVETI